MRSDQMKLRLGLRLVAACAAALGLSGALRAQQLWSVEEVTVQHVAPMLMNGVPVSAVTAVAAGTPTAEAAAVQVEFDYLRLGMGYLELPLADGSVIEAQNAVFEDRGGGNLMWTGKVPGAGYESVLFTVQDGHLVGWFGEPGGPKYIVYAGPDGRGSLTVEAGPTGDWCGVEARPSRDFVHGGAQAQDRRDSVASQSRDDRLDILVLYTTGTERFWRVIGGPAVGIRQLGDYLNMVFRNGAIPATANLIAVRWDPQVMNLPRTQGWHFHRPYDFLSRAYMWHSGFRLSAEAFSLRKRYKPDLLHFVASFGDREAAGRAEQRDASIEVLLWGWSTPYARVFAHEVGHNLGGHHEPATFGEYFAEFQSGLPRPYQFGHTDMTSCAMREGRGDLLWCPATTMSYGVDASSDDDPKTVSIVEPFYSSVRHKPNGWTIGVAGTSEVERVLYETVPVQVQSGEQNLSIRSEQRPRTIEAHWTGRDTVRVIWSSEVGGIVRLASAEGANDQYWWRQRASSNLTSVRDSVGGVLGVDIAGLRPGGTFRISAFEFPGTSPTGKLTRFLESDVFHLEPPRQVSGSPAAASNVGAQVTGSDSVRLYWRDNSRVETGYEVWYRKWSGDEPDDIWSRFGEPLPAQARYVDVEGLTAEGLIFVSGERAKIGRYSFVVVAYNDKGWNASEMFNLEFMPEPYPKPTTSGQFTDCAPRPTGIDLDGYQVDACLETPDGARRRAWDYQLTADQSGLLYFFDRDNAEILVKVLDGCAINGHRWVFLAPVTTLPFRLQIREPGPYIANRRQVWHYDSERRPQDRIQRNTGGRVGNPRDKTARTVSDTTAFPCTTAEIAAAKAAASDESRAAFALPGAVPPPTAASAARSLIAGARTDCEPGGPTLTLRGGYTVSMCYETYDGLVGDARDWGLDSSQSGLMYFFERNNAEVLIKVLDGCGVNGHRWVFVAPVTDLAFNLVVESPDGQSWTHSNRLGLTADAASDTSAFPCSSSA